MEEIEKNSYNINISRYVRTSVEEEIFDLEDLKSVVAELRAASPTADW